jgi:uncharacterized protein YbaR (Trm112 family)
MHQDRNTCCPVCRVPLKYQDDDQSKHASEYSDFGQLFVQGEPEAQDAAEAEAGLGMAGLGMATGLRTAAGFETRVCLVTQLLC